jgi:hypothetical protein
MPIFGIWLLDQGILLFFGKIRIQHPGGLPFLSISTPRLTSSSRAALMRFKFIAFSLAKVLVGGERIIPNILATCLDCI